jgi:hypothetical protein
MHRSPDEHDFGAGWLDTEVGRQVGPVVRGRVRRRLRAWARVVMARLARSR